MDVFTAWGPVGLFVAAFFAATILPLSSEIVLSALLLAGGPPMVLVLLATAGNVLGACFNYALGCRGGRPLLQRELRVEDAELARAEQRFKRWGTASLLLAWVPVIGDPLTVVAGILRVPVGWFLLLVGLGKCARYVALAYAFGPS